jgi:uncharacterized integral membrane protein (TIGR00698 family)
MQTPSSLFQGTLGRYLVPVGAACALFPFVPPGAALAIGCGVALLSGNPYLERTRKITHQLLAVAVVGLGAGMDLNAVGTVGLKGFGYTMIGISMTFLLGALLNRWIGTDRDAMVLITTGTAICGGSAIAAVAPAIRAKHHDVSVALGTVFMLNTVALFLFPWVGHLLHLNEPQFGLWCALAIHDTSSVVGATLAYGNEACKIGTTVKLARALWIVPVTFVVEWVYTRYLHRGSLEKPKRPWFILGFLCAAALVTWVPAVAPVGHAVAGFSKRLLVLTLFLIGANLTWETIKQVGLRPLLLGSSLWVLVGSLTLGAVWMGWIHL